MVKTLFILVMLASSINGLAYAAKAKEKPRIASPIGEAIQKDNFYPRVKLTTSMGDIIIELRRDRAPISVNNFLTYVRQKEYDNTVFHRVEPDHVIQGGGYTPDMKEKKANYQIINESGNGLTNEQYTVAMARINPPHSAKRQFFFNMKDNEHLNPGRSWGYAVFGEVVEGQEVLDAMALVATHVDPTTGFNNSPVEDVVLIRASILPEPKLD